MVKAANPKAETRASNRLKGRKPLYRGLEFYFPISKKSNADMVTGGVRTRRKKQKEREAKERAEAVAQLREYNEEQLEKQASTRQPPRNNLSDLGAAAISTTSSPSTSASGQPSPSFVEQSTTRISETFLDDLRNFSPPVPSLSSTPNQRPDRPEPITRTVYPSLADLLKVSTPEATLQTTKVTSIKTTASATMATTHQTTASRTTTSSPTTTTTVSSTTSASAASKTSASPTVVAATTGGLGALSSLTVRPSSTWTRTTTGPPVPAASAPPLASFTQSAPTTSTVDTSTLMLTLQALTASAPTTVATQLASALASLSLSASGGQIAPVPATSSSTLPTTESPLLVPAHTGGARPKQFFPPSTCQASVVTSSFGGQFFPNNTTFAPPRLDSNQLWLRTQFDLDISKQVTDVAAFEKRIVENRGHAPIKLAKDLVVQQDLALKSQRQQILAAFQSSPTEISSQLRRLDQVRDRMKVLLSYYRHCRELWTDSTSVSVVVSQTTRPEQDFQEQLRVFAASVDFQRQTAERIECDITTREDLIPQQVEVFMDQVKSAKSIIQQSHVILGGGPV